MTMDLKNAMKIYLNLEKKFIYLNKQYSKFFQDFLHPCLPDIVRDRNLQASQVYYLKSCPMTKLSVFRDKGGKVSSRLSLNDYPLVGL